MSETASVSVESYGLRLACICGREQYYSGVDDHVYLCTGCGREYGITQTRTGLALHELNGR